MFGEECMLPMDIGMPRRQPEPVDDVVSPYAVWVKDSLEVAFDQVRRHSGKAVRRQKQLYSTNHVYLHRPNAFGFWQTRLHLCYETLKRVSNFSELA